MVVMFINIGVVDLINCCRDFSIGIWGGVKVNYCLGFRFGL